MSPPAAAWPCGAPGAPRRTRCSRAGRPGMGRQFLECPGGGAPRILVEHRTLAAHRAAQAVVVGDLAGVFQRYVKKAGRDALEALEQLAPPARRANLVGEDAKALDAVIAAQDLDQGVGVGDRGGLV